LSAGTVGYQILSEGLNFDASGAMLTLAPPVAAEWNPVVSALTPPAAGAAGGAAAAGAGAGLAGSSAAGAPSTATSPASAPPSSTAHFIRVFMVGSLLFRSQESGVRSQESEVMEPVF